MPIGFGGMPINITVQSFLNSATNLTITIPDDSTVATLKSSIYGAEGTPTAIMNLYFNGTLLTDATVINAAGIVDGSYIASSNNLTESGLWTKQQRQEYKLELAALKRAADSNARAIYDITQLPTQYSGNNIVDNPNTGGLVIGRPWVSQSYSIGTIPSSINEGSAGTINVTTLGVTDGTTLYWTIETRASDFTASSGSFTVTSNAGSFTVTPTADLITEGTETFTVAIRTGSTSGTIVATTATVDINDTSTSPDSIAGLRFWIDTATTSTLNSGTYTDGATLTSWTERKQNASYVNPAAQYRPTIQSGAGDLKNGYPVVRFAFPSAGQWDQAEWTSVSGFANATGYTMVCVAKLTANALGASNHILRIRNTSGTYSSSFYYSTGNSRFEFVAPSGSTTFNNSVDPDGTWKIITVRYDSTAVLANRVTFRWAKTPVSFIGSTSSGALAADAGNNIQVGYFWDADWAEQMVYNTALSDADIVLLENYLSSKWGV